MGAPYDEKDYLSRLDMQIRTNLDLISHRMGWLLISQSFLFTAYALSASHVHNPVSDQRALGDMLHIVPMMGLVGCVFVGLSLYAAMWVIWQMKATRTNVERKLMGELERNYGASSVARGRAVDWIGHAPALAVPPLFIVAWIYLLVI